MDSLIARRRPFRMALLRWYGAAARRLPWREQPSLYKTVVSEFMLQQTQVATVIPYFQRWMAALPDWTALAGATETSVMKLWEGLGYYSRARRLHALAHRLAAMPALPATAAEWRELPGIGPYSAAAIASIALGEPCACVDGNVVRILARLSADGTLFRDSSEAAGKFASAAGMLLSPSSPGDFNQAMMELGATVCLRSSPLCASCPVSGYCAAARLGRPSEFPRLTRKRIESRSVVRVWCERRRAVLLHRQPDGGRRLAGLWELPSAQQAGMEEARAKGGPLLASGQRSITRFRISEAIHAAAPPRGRLGDGLAWVRLDKLGGVVLSGPHRRWVGEILGLPRSRRTGGVIRRPAGRSAPRRAISS